MRAIDSVLMRRLSPEDVLAILRDEYRYFEVIDDEVLPGYELTFETSVADWLMACNLLGWPNIGRVLNQLHGISLDDAAWRAVLEPEQQRTLRDVCALIAAHATLPALQPVRLLGASCSTAGAFLALRAQLRAMGASVERLRPSDLLESSLAGDAHVLYAACMLAPGRAPLPAVRRRPAAKVPLRLGVLLCCVGLLSIVAIWVLGLFGVQVGRTVGLALGLTLPLGVLIVYLTARLLPDWIEWPGLRTYGDLARVLAGAVSG